MTDDASRVTPTFAATSEAGPVRTAVLEITNRCNLRCPHCASSSGRARPGELTFAEISDLLRDVAELGGEEVTIIGGEALLREDWPEICGQVTRLGMDLVLITNGLKVDDGANARIAALRPYILGVSLDGATRESYRALRGVDGFEHCVGLLRGWVAEGHENVNAITTFWKANLREFDAFATLLEGTGITWQVQIANRGGHRFDDGMFISRTEYAWLCGKMRAAFVERRGRLRLRHMDDFGYFPVDPALRFLHRSWNGCTAGIDTIGIRSNGDVLGCLSLGDEFVEANVRQRPLAAIWRSEASFRRFRHKEELLTGECALCSYAARCRGGCSGIAWSATGTLGRNPYCLRALEIDETLQGFAEPDPD